MRANYILIISGALLAMLLVFFDGFTWFSPAISNLMLIASLLLVGIGTLLFFWKTRPSPHDEENHHPRHHH